jgi:hypothetical protein
MRGMNDRIRRRRSFIRGVSHPLRRKTSRMSPRRLPFRGIPPVDGGIDMIDGRKGTALRPTWARKPHVTHGMLATKDTYDGRIVTPLGDRRARQRAEFTRSLYAPRLSAVAVREDILAWPDRQRGGCRAAG